MTPWHFWFAGILVISVMTLFWILWDKTGETPKAEETKLPSAGIVASATQSDAGEKIFPSERQQMYDFTEVKMELDTLKGRFEALKEKVEAKPLRVEIVRGERIITNLPKEELDVPPPPPKFKKKKGLGRGMKSLLKPELEEIKQ